MAKKEGGKVAKAMKKFKAGTLHSGSKDGPKVESKAQALAIGLNEERASKKAPAKNARTRKAGKRA